MILKFMQFHGIQQMIKYLKQGLNHLQFKFGQLRILMKKTTKSILNIKDQVNRRRREEITNIYNQSQRYSISNQISIIHELVDHIQNSIKQKSIPLFAFKEIVIQSCEAEQKDLSRFCIILLIYSQIWTVLGNGQIKGYGAGIAILIVQYDNFTKVNYEQFDSIIHTDHTYQFFKKLCKN